MFGNILLGGTKLLFNFILGATEIFFGFLITFIIVGIIRKCNVSYLLLVLSFLFFFFFLFFSF